MASVWIKSEFPLQPTGAVQLQVLEGATLTTFSRGRLRVAWGQPSRYVSGAVYDSAGQLVPASQRIGGLHYDHALSVDPPTLPEWGGETTQLPGTWLYGGTWFNHFGHFLTETVTTLWPDVVTDGVVFHPFWFGREVLPWQAAGLRLLAVTDRPAVVGANRLRVERLLVPTRPYLPNGYAMPEAVNVWRRMARAAASHEPVPRPSRVYLSRSAYHQAQAEAGTPSRRSVPNEGDLDELFRARGYEVVCAERLAMADQVRLATDAQLLVGVSGSALHLSAFAPASTTVVEVGDPRARSGPVRTQVILCHASGQRLGFVPFASAPVGYDLASVAAELDRLEI